MSLRAAAGFFFGQLGAITGLAYFYGWVSAGSFLSYFGIDRSLVDLSTTDYIVRAATGPAFFPLIILSVVAALAGLAHPRIVTLLQTKEVHVGRRYAVTIATVGLVVAVFGFYRTFLYLSWNPIGDALIFAAGLGMLYYGLLLPKHSGDGNQAPLGAVPQLALAALIVIALLSAVRSYADSVGEASAQTFSRQLASRSDVRVYSASPLSISARGVSQSDSGQEGGLRYRYDGLSLLVRSGDRYILIPKEWRSREDPVLVLKEGDSLRFEFT